MSQVSSAESTAPALSQWQRLAGIFSAPSRTFDDIRRGRSSWWAPLLLFVIIGASLWSIVGTKVGWQTVAENNMRMSPKLAEQVNSLSAEQRERQMAIMVASQKVTWLVAPVAVLVMNLIAAGILLATINFGFAGRATFGQVLAVVWYGGLPGLIKLILGGIALFVGLEPESFLPANPAGTNLAFYLSMADTNRLLYVLASAFDITTIWTMVLVSIGLAIVAGVKRQAAFIAVFGWWAVLVLGSIGVSLIFS